MAYTLGFICADGNIVKNREGGCYVSISSADLCLVRLLRGLFESTHKISKRVSKTGCVFRIQIGSKEWFNDLKKLDITPNKSRRLSMPKGIPPEMISHFVRGYFDGDGNVWVGFVNKNKTNKTKVIYSAFTSCCYGFLESLLKLLKSVGLSGGGIYKPKKGNYHRLSFASKDTLILYRFMYNNARHLCLDRKRQIFKDFVDFKNAAVAQR